VKLEVLRFSSQEESTLGVLFDVTEGRRSLLSRIHARRGNPRLDARFESLEW